MHYTSSTLIFELTERLLERGAPTAAIEREVSAPVPPPDDPDVRWPLAAFAALVEMTVRELDDPALGLHVADRIPARRQHTAVRIARASRTLREAADSMARYAQLITTSDRFVPEDGPKRSRQCYKPDPSAPVIRLLHEHHMVQSKHMVDAMLGPNASAAKASYGFSHSAPAYVSEYHRILGPNVKFDEPCTYIEVEHTAVDQPAHNYDPYLGAVLRDAAERRLASLEIDPSTGRRVLEILGALPPDPPPSRSLVADALGMSEKALQRKLDLEGITFRELFDRHRRERAIEWVKQGRAASDIAYSLGFSETAAFARAFRRWTGTTISRYRGAHRQSA